VGGLLAEFGWLFLGVFFVFLTDLLKLHLLAGPLFFLAVVKGALVALETDLGSSPVSGFCQLLQVLIVIVIEFFSLNIFKEGAFQLGQQLLVADQLWSLINTVLFCFSQLLRQPRPERRPVACGPFLDEADLFSLFRLSLNRRPPVVGQQVSHQAGVTHAADHNAVCRHPRVVEEEAVERVLLKAAYARSGEIEGVVMTTTFSQGRV